MLRLYIKIYCSIFSILFLAGCVTPIRQPLTNQDKANIKSTRILLNTTQREMVIQSNNPFNSDLPDPYAPMDSGAIVHYNSGYNSSIGPVGNLFVSGIQAVRSLTERRSLISIKNALQSFDFISYFNLELQNKVSKLPWLKVKKQEVKYNLQGYETDNVSLSNENTTLFIGATYSLNSTFRKLEVVAYVKLMEKPMGKQSPRALYANNFFFVNRLPQPCGNSKYNKVQWLKDNGYLLKTKLRDAASLLSNMLAMDMIDPNPVIFVPENSQLLTIRPFNGVAMKGKLIKFQDNYFIISFEDGTLGAVNSEDIIKREDITKKQTDDRTSMRNQDKASMNGTTRIDDLKHKTSDKMTS